LINVNGDLLGAALSGDMLGARQRRAPTVAGEPDEILRYERYRAPRALFPRRVSRRIDDDLTHDSPPSMVRIATRNQKPGQRLGHPQSSGLGPVTVQVPQRGTHLPPALHRSGQLPGCPPRLASFIIDPSTVLGHEATLRLDSDDRRRSPESGHCDRRVAATLRPCVAAAALTTPSLASSSPGSAVSSTVITIRGVTLDPQVVSYLDQLRAAGDPAPWEVPLEDWRRSYDQAAADMFGPAGPVATVEDLDANGVPARVYRPAGGELPGLVYCHGGGWVIGSLESHDPLCRTLAARSGCAVIAVDYRLAPEHSYPAAVQDAWTATAWAAQRFARLAVAGDSAGGQLAASVGLRARDAGLPLALQVLIYPVTNYAFETQSYRDNTEGPALNAAEMRWFWSKYVRDEAQADEPDCSPLRAPELAGLPPALVLSAEYDPLRDEGEAYARRLEQAGVPVDLRRYDGLIHGFIRMPALITRADGAIDDVAAAIRSALRPTAV
jgi:acetyl esterase